MRVQNVVVPTNDFPASVRFYRDVLGLAVSFQSESYCFVHAGAVQIAIHPVNPENHFAPTGHGIYLDIAVDDFPAVRAKLAVANVTPVREWEDDGTPFVLIADPDGNLLEIYAGA